MTDIPLGLGSSLLKELSSSLKDKFNAHDFDLALGFINSAITKSASEKDTLLALYLLKCLALFGNLSTTMGDSIDDNKSRMLTPWRSGKQRSSTTKGERI